MKINFLHQDLKTFNFLNVLLKRNSLSVLKFAFLIFFNVFFLTETNAQCSVTATKSGYNAAFNMVYVLTDVNGIIIAENGTGTFLTPADGTFKIHALNYDGTNAPAPLPAALIGQNINLVGSTTAGCFNANFLTDFVTRSCANCNLSATTSGYNAAFTHVYVLTDESGIILDQNATGSFSAPNTGVFHIHALNYDGTDAPSPLPSALLGQNINLVGSTAAGCFNADFFTDFVLRTCSVCYEERSICESDNFTVGTMGENAAYQQLYVLTFTSGEIVNTSATGDFTGQISAGTSYRVYALNYDLGNPPVPLPVAGGFLEGVGSTSTGCKNSDFFTDYLCYTVTDCILPLEWLSFEGKCMGEKIALQWETTADDKTEFFTILSSENGKSWAESGKVKARTSGGKYSYTLPSKANIGQYFRLKRSGKDEKADFSKMIFVACTSAAGEVTLFPNPSAGKISLSGLYAPCQIQITNTQGLILEEYETQQNIFEADFSQKHDGIYFLNVIFSDKKVVKKLVISH